MPSKEEYFWRTSRGATSMVFFNAEDATKWRNRQVARHGNTLAPAKLIKRVTTVQEIEIEPATSETKAIGTTVLKESNDSKVDPVFLYVQGTGLPVSYPPTKAG